MAEEQAPEENWVEVDQQFGTQYRDLQAKILSWQEITSGDSEKVVELFNELQVQFLALREMITGIGYALPTKLVGRYQQQLSELQGSLDQEKEKAIPKKKFKFERKNRVKKAVETKTVETDAQSQIL